MRTAGVKEGLTCVYAPDDLLDRCVAVRLALDPVAEDDLFVVPGSHQRSAPTKHVQRTGLRSRQGGAVLMRPLLLHGSRRLCRSDVRRVLHFVFGPPDLPAGYSWQFEF